jgi:thiol-disulfide isomerase/thioredoxin
MMKQTVLRAIFFFLAVFLFSACDNHETKTSTEPERWRATLATPGGELPFHFTISSFEKGITIQIENGNEKVEIEDVSKTGDSIFIKFTVYNSEIRAKMSENIWEGNWFNYAKAADYAIPFTARTNIKDRFLQKPSPKLADISGKWEVEFVYNSTDSSYALGVFQQNGNQLSGTFMTPTGDYRFLEGQVSGDSLFLSCFDGAHAFLFKAKASGGDSISGDFWSGTHWHERWYAKRNPKYRLPDPDSLTFLKEGFEKIEFCFPDLQKKEVCLSDDRFKNKVTIVQIMGSWCPNCMDETTLYSEIYLQYREQGLECVALAFERSGDFEKTKPILDDLVSHFDIKYPVLFAGKATKSEASKKLPMLNHIMSFPTSIFINKEGKVVKIHTGFSGPATGKHYDKFVSDLHTLLNELLNS